MKFSLFLAMMTVGCGAQEIREQAEEAHEDRRVMAIFPSDGSMALRGDVGVQVVLGDEKLGTLPNVKVSTASKTWTPACSLNENGLWVTCNPISDLPRNQVFDIEIGLQDQNPLTVSTSSEFPEGQQAFLINTNAAITAFGESESTAQRVGEMFQGSNMIALIDEYDGGTGDYTLLMGPVDYEQGSKATIREPGLTFVKDIVVNDTGRFTSRVQNAFMPIFVDTGFVQVLIQDCVAEGTIEDGAITGMKISGIIPALSLVQLAEPLGAAANFVLAGIEMDVDLDADGENDAASFSLVSTPVQVGLVQY